MRIALLICDATGYPSGAGLQLSPYRSYNRVK